MKRKFLEDLGLETDVIEKIMTESGKDRTNLQAKVDDLIEQVNVKEETIKQKNDRIKELEKVDVEQAKTQAFEEGKRQGSKEIEEFKKNSSLEKYLKEKFKVKDPSLIKPKIDMKKVKYNDEFEIVEGLEEQINPLKESHDYLFESDKPLPKFSDKTDGGKTAEITKETFNKMSYRERLNLKKEQPETYENLKNE